MRRSFLFLILVLLAVPATGCFSYRYSGAVAPTPPAAGKEDIALFSYDKKADVPITVSDKTKDKGKYLLRDIKWRYMDFPELKHQHATAFLFEPKDKSVKRPGLIVLPPTGGPMDIVKGFAAYYAERGFAVIAMRRREPFFNPDQSMDYNQKLIRQAVIDARRAIDYLSTRDYVDPEKICVMGISLGGIIGALAMESDGRVKAAGFHVTAGHLADILMTSGYSRVSNFRDALKQELNLTDAELRDGADKLLHSLDPTTYADRLDPGRIVMVNGAFDDIVRQEVVFKTRESYGKPQQYFVPAGHYTAIGFSGYGNKKIYQHFVKVLNLDAKALRK